MRFSVANTETSNCLGKCFQSNLHFSRLKQIKKLKYFGVIFKSDEKQKDEVDARISDIVTITHALQNSVFI